MRKKPSHGGQSRQTLPIASPVRVRLESRHMEISSGLRASNANADEQRLKNYRNQVQRQHEIELKEIATNYDRDLEKLTQTKSMELEDVRSSYDVRISEEAESLDEKLQQIREDHEKRITLEKDTSDEELNKLKTANRLRIEDYKKNAELQVDSMKKELQENIELVHEQSKKAAKREREANLHDSR